MADSSYTLIDTAGATGAAKTAYRTTITGVDSTDLSVLSKLPTEARSSVAVTAQFDNAAETAGLSVILYSVDITVGGAATYVTVGQYAPTTVTATAALATTGGDNMSPTLTVNTLGASHFAVYVAAVTGTITRINAWTY